MSRKLRKEKFWFFGALAFYLGCVCSCRAVSLSRRGDVFEGENRDGGSADRRWPAGQELQWDTNVVAPVLANSGAASSDSHLSPPAESHFAFINSSWTVGQSRRLGTSGLDSSNEEQAAAAGQCRLESDCNLYTWKARDTPARVLYVLVSARWRLQQSPAVLSAAGEKGQIREGWIYGCVGNAKNNMYYCFFSPPPHYGSRFWRSPREGSWPIVSLQSGFGQLVGLEAIGVVWWWCHDLHCLWRRTRILVCEHRYDFYELIETRLEYCGIWWVMQTVNSHVHTQVGHLKRIKSDGYIRW